MKKHYEKPMLYAERFELAEHITNCTGIEPGTVTSANYSDCVFTYDGVTYFSDPNACQIKPSDFGMSTEQELIDSLLIQCWEGSTGGAQLFNS